MREDGAGFGEEANGDLFLVGYREHLDLDGFAARKLRTHPTNWFLHLSLRVCN
jgi:hypothetical protein